MNDPRTAETIAKYHDEHAGHGGASWEFHARAATFIRSSAAEVTRLAARVARLEAVLRAVEWGGKCGELFVVEICPVCGGSTEHEHGCALDAAKGAEHE